VPVVDGNRVFVYGAAGDLHAVNISDGKPIWTRKLRSEYDAQDGYFGAGSTPLVVGQTLIALIGGRNGAGVVALDVQNGKTRWTASDEEASYASPVTMQLDNRTVVVAVMGLNTLVLDLESGNIVRRFDFGRRGPVVNAATPLVDGTRLFVTASYGIGCRMVDLKTETPTDIWQSRDVISSQYASPVRSGDHLYAITGRQDIGDAGLLCVRWADGKTTWTRPDFGTGHLIIAGNRVLAQLTDGRLDLFAADPTAYKRLATADLPPGSYKSLPAFSGGTLFCRRTISSTEGELIALQW
jgi:outer membrane protein assembly factor BamB